MKYNNKDELDFIEFCGKGVFTAGIIVLILTPVAVVLFGLSYYIAVFIGTISFLMIVIGLRLMNRNKTASGLIEARQKIMKQRKS